MMMQCTIISQLLAYKWKPNKRKLWHRLQTFFHHIQRAATAGSLNLMPPLDEVAFVLTVF